MIKAIIFDCFGVVYPDTLSYVERAFLKDVNDSRAEDIRKLRRQCDMGLVSRDDFWDSAAKILGISRSELDSKLDEVRGADWELLDYISNLKKTYKTAMLSNVGKGFLERIFDSKHPQEKYFNAVLASSDIGIMKPDIQAYKMVASVLNIPTEECVFVDDLPKNANGAERAGMKAILYQDFAQMKKELELILKED
jgi:FMN phosphatase YigB (HAD superfamily)